MLWKFGRIGIDQNIWAADAYIIVNGIPSCLACVDHKINIHTHTDCCRLLLNKGGPRVRRSPESFYKKKKKQRSDSTPQKIAKGHAESRNSRHFPHEDMAAAPSMAADAAGTKTKVLADFAADPTTATAREVSRLFAYKAVTKEEIWDSMDWSKDKAMFLQVARLLSFPDGGVFTPQDVAEAERRYDARGSGRGEAARGRDCTRACEATDQLYQGRRGGFDGAVF